MPTLVLVDNPNLDHTLLDQHININHSGNNYCGRNIEGSSLVLHFETLLTSGEEQTISDYWNSLTPSDRLFDEGVDKLAIFDCYGSSSVDDRYIPFSPPMDLDYRKSLDIRLAPVVTIMEKGEVQEIVYYKSAVKNADGSLTGTDPVIRESFNYVRDSQHVAISREMTIEWYKIDGSIHPTSKTRDKIYSTQDAIREGVRRRTNIIDALQIPVVGLLVQTEGITLEQAYTEGNNFMHDYQPEITSFINTPLFGDLNTRLAADSTYTWLDNWVPGTGDTVSIRAFMLNEITDD